jgi:Transmembrane family, TMEM144 of transporters
MFPYRFGIGLKFSGFNFQRSSDPTEARARQSNNSNQPTKTTRTIKPPSRLSPPLTMTSATIFDGCDDSCGWTAAIIAALAYGSFGVPIKETNSVKTAHPLVLQSYKTVTMFAMSWLVLAMGVAPSFTPWGILSGTLWVLGGTGGIYAIRKAGMATAVGTWASVMIVVNFTWGILIFQEPVHDIAGVTEAFLLLAVGLVGMSYFAAPSDRDNEHEEQMNFTPSPTPSGSSSSANSATSLMIEAEERLDAENPFPRAQLIQRPSGAVFTIETTMNDDASSQSKPHFVFVDDDNRPLSSTMQESSPMDVQLFGRFSVSERTAGILGAVFNGLMTGSSLVPIHYAKEQGYGGANYMISFASGGMLANTGIWGVYAAYLYRQNAERQLPGSILYQTYSSLPPWHLQRLLLPGCIAGALLTIAMFGSILSVTYLGQGIGNSVIQSKILIRCVH